jgi:hypothetical protein
MTKPLRLELDRSAKTPLAEQIRKGIGAAIESGVLAPGARLPSWLDFGLRRSADTGPRSLIRSDFSVERPVELREVPDVAEDDFHVDYIREAGARRPENAAKVWQSLLLQDRIALDVDETLIAHRLVASKTVLPVVGRDGLPGFRSLVEGPTPAIAPERR